MKRGNEHETMPYFLTDQYREILRASLAQKEALLAAQEENASKKKG